MIDIGLYCLSKMCGIGQKKKLKKRKEREDRSPRIQFLKVGLFFKKLATGLAASELYLKMKGIMNESVQ